MNFLAHAYLSFGDPGILTGNLISDFVKGKKKFDFAPEIQAGIALHRAIDEFTDSHEMTGKAKTFFRKVYGLYSGPLVDVVYDHFLANDPASFPRARGLSDARAEDRRDEDALGAFTTRTYQQLEMNQAIFPETFARIFPYMRRENWLYHYRFRQGIFNSFKGLSMRASRMGSSEPAFRLFEEYYTELGACYRSFFPELKNHAQETLLKLWPPARQ